MNIDKQIKDLIKKTTIYLVEDSHHEPVVGEDKISRFQSDQGTPVTIEELEPKWQTIFGSFGDKWDKNRQLYRLLYDQIRLFITSFTFLRIHKVDHINSDFNDENSFRQFSNHLASMYVFGKKATDLIKEFDGNKSDFSIRFSNTRNLVFEHNYGSYLLSGYIVDPSFFEASGTTSKMRIRLHSLSKESVYSAYVDYYEDYYQLESEIINWINKQKCHINLNNN